ncbi:dienelactone hydrolase family protein [Methyloferula stellata]|uniref:dienelactone hydrolase family protein n=1 Tax=Methyloferula stellata TaxID=876270 RepID=UPI00035E3DB0|nr:dienelactone hydrolase family protein [Methyloferula stellata]
MASVILFHSVMGLRQVERDAAAQMRAAGHEAVTPDLYEGQTAETIAEGFALMGRIGWNTICERAEKAISELPASTVLAGLSMGAGIVAALWPKRQATKGVLLIHALADIPDNTHPGLPLQVHIADPDHFVHDAQMSDWRTAAKQVSLAAELFTYPGVGHFYTDPASPDYDAKAAALTWDRALAFLKEL